MSDAVTQSPATTEVKTDKEKLEALDVRKRELEIQALQTELKQKRYLWPVTNVSALVTLATLMWNGLVNPVLVANNNAALANANAKRAIKSADIANERSVEVIKDNRTLANQKKIDPNASHDKILDSAGKVSDLQSAPAVPVPSIPKSQLTSVIEPMFSPDRAIGKSTVSKLIANHVEDENFVTEVIRQASATSQVSNLPGLINSVDVLMYVPRYRFRPFMKDLPKLLANVSLALSKAKENPVNERDVTRLTNDVRLLTERIARINRTGKG